MKTITLELDEQIYPQVVSFLRLLPDNLCLVIEDNDTDNRDFQKFLLNSQEMTDEELREIEYKRKHLNQRE